MSTVHLHLALTHVPVVGVVIAFLLLAAALLFRKEEVVRAGLWLFVLSAVAAVAVYFTGEGAEHAVEGLAGVSEPIMELHEDAARVAMLTLGAYGVLSLIALIAFRPRIPRGVAFGGLALAILPLAALLWTANLGGQIRHSEIRTGGVAGASQEAPERDREKRREEH